MHRFWVPQRFVSPNVLMSFFGFRRKVNPLWSNDCRPQEGNATEITGTRL